MTALVARAILSLATRCLSTERRSWAHAMEGEFEAALEDGRALSFATGCLVAAMRGMPAHEEGRLRLTSYALTLGVLLPVAVLQIACAFGLPILFEGGNRIYGQLAAGSARDQLAEDALLAAVPSLLVLWLILAASHVRIAWSLLDRNWPAVVRASAVAVAASLTLAVFTCVLFLQDTSVLIQAVVLVGELAAIRATARWHLRLVPTFKAGVFH